MNIPFVDLNIQYRTIKSTIDKALNGVIESATFIGGKHVRDFEEAYAKAYGVKHCISVGSGTDALYVTMKSLGIGTGDEVITVANSWISTSETITQTGAKVVFVDIEPKFYTIDVAKIEEKITPRTKAIIPVHLYGQPADIYEIQALCNEHNLYLIEDCAQAHFSQYNEKRVGTFGIAGTFSFYPGKNLGAWGDAGAVVTNDDHLAKQIRIFSNHGSPVKHQHDMEGINSRMDSIQAAVVHAKLSYIHSWNEQRHQHALLYHKLLQGIEKISLPAIRENCTHIFHLYVIRTQGKRDHLQKYLTSHGIQTGIHYPTALPFLPAYHYLHHHPEDFPVAYSYQSDILSLPMFPELRKEQIEYVAETIIRFFDN